MANIAAKDPINVPIKECSNLLMHMEMKAITLEELKKELLRRGCYMTDSIGELQDFIRKRYPGLTNMEVDDLINRKVFYCKL